MVKELFLEGRVWVRYGRIDFLGGGKKINVNNFC